MSPVEVIARALAAANCQIDQFEISTRRQTAIERKWPEYELEARRLVRSLKGQPPHITDAGLGCPWRYALDEMLEAMARS